MARVIHVETLHDPHSYTQAEAEEMLEVWCLIGRDKGRLLILTAPENGCSGCSHCRHMEKLKEHDG